MQVVRRAPLEELRRRVAEHLLRDAISVLVGLAFEADELRTYAAHERKRID
ncbi:hypothetical protein D9M68_929980 [compost metagenome]